MDTSKFITSKELHEREFRACGQTETVFFRRLPAIELRKYYAGLTSQDQGERAQAGFEALAKSLRTHDGKPDVTAAQLGQMDSEAIKALSALSEEIHAPRSDDDLGNG